MLNLSRPWSVLDTLNVCGKFTFQNFSDIDRKCPSNKNQKYFDCLLKQVPEFKFCQRKVLKFPFQHFFLKFHQSLSQQSLENKLLSFLAGYEPITFCWSAQLQEQNQHFKVKHYSHSTWSFGYFHSQISRPCDHKVVGSSPTGCLFFFLLCLFFCL